MFIGKYIKAIGLLFLLTLVQHGHAESIPIDRVVAVVNEDVVMESEFNQNLLMVIRQIQKQGQRPPPPEILKEQVMEKLIVESLQLQLAERVGVTLNPEEVKQTVERIARQNNVSIAQLQQTIIQDGLSFQTFQKSIARDLIIQRLQQGVVNGRIDISEQDIDNFLNSEEGKRSSNTTYHIAHITLPFKNNNDEARQAALDQANEILSRSEQGEDFGRLAIQYSKSPDAQSGGDLGWRKKAELPSLYAQTIDKLSAGQTSDPILGPSSYHLVKLLDKKGDQEYWVQQSKVRHILIKPSAIRSETEAGKVLSELREEIVSGEVDFAEAAKDYSEDYGSALKGGDLGWVSPGQMVPEFQQVMDNSQVNVVSMPFQSQYGWHILEVQERRDEDMSDVLIRKSVQNYLMQRRFEEELPIWLKEIRDEAFVEIKI